MKIIMPDEGGVPNFEIRKLTREIEEERANRAANPKTANELAENLEKVQNMALKGQVRAMSMVALLTKEADVPHSALAVFCAGGDHSLELYQHTMNWLMQIGGTIQPPPPKTDG